MLANFSWLVPGRIAGMGRPGGWNWEDLSRDIDLLQRQGVRALVSLTEDALDGELLRQRDILYLHLPIVDMQAPTIEEMTLFTAFADRAEGEERPIAVHCGAGLGRTGTMLAAYLVKRGRDASAAMQEVRSRRPGSIETPAQEAAIFAYAAQIKNGVPRK